MLRAPKTTPRLTTVRVALDIVATVAMVIVAGVLLYRAVSGPSRPGPRALRMPSDALSLEGASRVGSQLAPVVMLEFSDFECPYCGQFANTILPSLRKQYIDSGRVELAFRHFPLGIHQNARSAALAATCASRLGQFVAFHDLLFAQPRQLDKDSLERHRQQIGLDPEQYAACMATEAEPRLRKDLEIAKSLGISGTPAFFVGRRNSEGMLVVQSTIQGTKALADFVAVLEKALATQ